MLCKYYSGLAAQVPFLLGGRLQRDGWLGGDSTSGRNRPGEEAAKEGRKELINLPSSFLACMTSSLLLSPCYIPPTAIVNELMRAEGERERESGGKSLWRLH